MDKVDALSRKPVFLLARSAPIEESYSDGKRNAILSLSSLELARREISVWPGYQPTPLVALRGLAADAGVGDIYYKDEGGRFGLGSFKALGGAYAVLRLLQKQVAAQSSKDPGEISMTPVDDAAVHRTVTVTCATDGNHGRSVAWGAKTFGCRCVIYVHEMVSKGRRAAIAAYGADVREVAGNYDDAVRQASVDAAANGWHVVSDTSYAGYIDVPRDVMQGYGVMVEEALAQLPAGKLPTHVFVQGGVGGLAAAVCATLWEALGTKRPQFIVVEPDRAPCLFRSSVAGHPVTVDGSLNTIMAGLACGEVSLLAWEILREGANAFMTIEDEAAIFAMRLLADSPFGDQSLVAGESAVAGLAGMLQLTRDQIARDACGLNKDSVVLVFGTEGATDPVLYEELVGRPAEMVLTA